jgi:hypothetical protein
MAQTEFEKRLSLSSVPLVRLDKDDKPDGEFPGEGFACQITGGA